MTSVLEESAKILDGSSSANTTGTDRMALTLLKVNHIDLIDDKLIHFGAGTDVIINGGFDADTDWTKGSGWTIADGKAVAAAASADLEATVAPLTAGRSYRVTYTISEYSGGTITATCGTQAGTTRSANGTYIQYVTANDTGFKFATSGFTGKIDSVSATLADLSLAWTGSGLEVRVDGAIDFIIAANSLTALAGSTIKSDTIAETTDGTGVTVESTVLKDGDVALPATGAVTAGLVTASAINLADSKSINFGTGTDVIVNGAFSADTDWTKGGGWTIADGVAVATGAISTDLEATAAPLTSSATYRVTFTVATWTAGTITPTCGTQAGTARGAVGTYVEYITANGTGFKFATAGFTGTIDNVKAELVDVAIQWNGSNLDIAVAGATDFTLAANTFTASAGSTIKTDALAETTTGAGVMCGSYFQAHGNAAVTATTGGGTTGLIPAGASFVTVTSDSADKQISLPAGTIGDVIVIQMTGTGCELIAVTAADKVNNVVVGTTNELALVATSTYTCRYVAANTWIVTGLTNLGAAEAALVPDAL